MNHESDERLELYALGRLPDSELYQAEEHLLVCGNCRTRLEDIGAFALTMRETLKSEPVPARTDYFAWLSWLTPRMATAGAFAAVILALGIYWIGQGTRVAPMASLQLTAMRGEMQTTGVARELDLTLIDAPSTGRPFRLEVVDGSGGNVWSGVPDNGAHGLEAKIVHRLSPGDYFARLYGGNGELLHEYGFRVKG